MRLRRETGDFRIICYLDSTQTPQAMKVLPIQKNLSCEDLIGQIIEWVDNLENKKPQVLYTVNSADSGGDDVITLTSSGAVSDVTLLYHPSSGEIEFDI